MEEIENRLFDLLENQAFEHLSEEHRLFVLTHITEQEYNAQRKVMLLAEEVDYPTVVPLPFSPANKKAGALMSPIPLYQVLIGIAALFIGVSVIWPESNHAASQLAATPMMKTDTIYVTKVKTDTIVIHSEKIQIAATEKPKDTVYVYKKAQETMESNRMLEPGSNQPLIVLDEHSIKTKGRTLKEESVLGLLPNLPRMGL